MILFFHYHLAKIDTTSSPVVIVRIKPYYIASVSCFAKRDVNISSKFVHNVYAKCFDSSHVGQIAEATAEVAILLAKANGKVNGFFPSRLSFFKSNFNTHQRSFFRVDA